MSATPLTDEELLDAVRALHAANGVKADAARALNLDRGTYRHRLEVAARRGLLGTDPVLPGFEIREVTTRRGRDGDKIGETIRQGPEREAHPFEPPEGMQLAFGTYQRDADGNVIQDWVRYKPGQMTVEQVINIARKALTEFEPAAHPRPAPTVSEDRLTLIPCADWHVNLLAWSRETGENWDLKIAEKVIGEKIEDVVLRSPLSAIGVVLGGGDLLHADTNDNRTSKSGNALDADGRHEKGLEAAIRLMVRTIEAALERNRSVIVRILKGNHDEYSSVAVVYYLAAYYRNEPRVIVDTDPSLFWRYRFGNVLLGATHGHTVKLGEMPGIMAHRRAKDWGDTRYRYAHGFHIHHKTKQVTEGEGVVCESHQTPVAQDAYHFGSGYLSGRSVQTITYHRDTGEESRVRAAIPDQFGEAP